MTCVASRALFFPTSLRGILLIAGDGGAAFGHQGGQKAAAESKPAAKGAKGGGAENCPPTQSSTFFA